MRKIKLHSKKYNLYAMIDDVDYDRVIKHHWNPHVSKKNNTIYVKMTRGKNKTGIYLHRFILGLLEYDGKIVVDHWNGDGLNCTRDNLRKTNHSGNALNRRMKLKSIYQ